MVNIYKRHQQELVDKIMKLGPYNKLSLNKFKSLRLITTIIVFILGLFLNFNYFFALLLSILYYNLFRGIFLDARLIQRNNKLKREALYFLEVLKISLAKNDSFIKALELTALSVKNEFAGEVKLTLLELKFGKSFKEAFSSMSNRLPGVCFKNLINELILMYETNNRDTSILDKEISKLESDYDELKAKQVKLLPNIISLVAITFILPLILFIIFGPNMFN